MEFNWIDWIVLAVAAWGAIRGFMRGLVVELASLVGIVVGLWAAVRFNDRVAEWLGLSPEREVLSFVVTFLGVLIALNLLARAITAALDIVQLGLLNKLAGTLFGTIRALFVLSVFLNVALAHEPDRAIPDHRSRERSITYGAVQAFGPLLVPALEDTRWMTRAWEAVRTWERDKALREAAPDPDTVPLVDPEKP